MTTPVQPGPTPRSRRSGSEGRAPDGLPSLGDQVYVALREEVLSNKYRPGEHLRQEAIAASYGVSRVPVRSALIQLEAEGLVELLDRRGAVVRMHSAAEIQELCQIRAVLEGYAIRRSMRTMNPDRVRRLKELLIEADQRSTSVVDPRADYYRELYDAGRNPHLNKLLEDLRLTLGRYLHGWQRSGGHEHAHHELVDVIARGDEEGAVRVVHHNLAQVRNAILERLGSEAPQGLRAVVAKRGGSAPRV